MEDRAKLMRYSTMPVLEPGGAFWHRDCVSRACQILGLFFLLAIGGTATYFLVSPILGAFALAAGPSFIVMWIFYKRFQCSTTKLQALYTFLEAIVWMMLLFVVIEFVDWWNMKISETHLTVECAMEADEGGKVFVHELALAARCFNVTDGSDAGPAIRSPGAGVGGPGVDPDGPYCSQFHQGVFAGTTIQLLVDGPRRNLYLPPQLLMLAGSEAVKWTNGTACRAVEDDVPSALGAVMVKSVAVGGSSVDTSTRFGMSVVYDELFGRHAGGKEDCECARHPLDGGGPLAYDFCDEADRCLVSKDAICVDRGNLPGGKLSIGGLEADCSPEVQGTVTAVFSFEAKTVQYAFIEAYFRAAFLEELLKYVAVRRILFKDRVVDCGGLLVYGLAGAAGFATAENIQYALVHGVAVTYLRMILSIPLHCCTGMMIGIHLGYRKFLGEGKMCLDKFLYAMAMPVLIHGTYDFILMLPSYVPIDQGWRMLISVIVLVSGFVICRFMWLRIDNVCIVHVKDLQRDGRVSEPACCCCECDCCRAWCTQEDPLLTAKPGQEEDSSGASSDSDRESPLQRARTQRLSWSVSSQLLPEAPTCQTREETCPSCHNTVRVHVFFPSDCPFCGHQFPDPSPTNPQQP